MPKISTQGPTTRRAPPPAPKGNRRALGNRGGRPTLFRLEYVGQAYELALLGKTDAEIAGEFDVSEDAVNDWKHRHPEFRQSIARGRALADGKVAAALYRRGTGYDYDGRHYPPDTAAASLWLRNRQPKLWRERTDVAVSGQLTLEQLVIGSMTDPRAADAAAMLIEEHDRRILGAPSQGGGGRDPA